MIGKKFTIRTDHARKALQPFHRFEVGPQRQLDVTLEFDLVIEISKVKIILWLTLFKSDADTIKRRGQRNYPKTPVLALQQVQILQIILPLKLFKNLEYYAEDEFVVP